MENQSEPISQDPAHTVDIPVTFKEALEALDILISQQGSPRVRDEHKHTIRDYLIKQQEILTVYQDAARKPYKGLYRPVNGNFTRLEHIRLLAAKIEGLTGEIRRLQDEISKAPIEHD